MVINPLLDLCLPTLTSDVTPRKTRNVNSTWCRKPPLVCICSTPTVIQSGTHSAPTLPPLWYASSNTTIADINTHLVPLEATLLYSSLDFLRFCRRSVLPAPLPRLALDPATLFLRMAVTPSLPPNLPLPQNRIKTRKVTRRLPFTLPLKQPSSTMTPMLCFEMLLLMQTG